MNNLHYALLDENNIVINTIIVSSESDAEIIANGHTFVKINYPEELCQPGYSYDGKTFISDEVLVLHESVE